MRKGIIYVGRAQDMYAEDKRVWNRIFEMVSQDLAACERDGLDVGGEVVYPIILGNKGDWSYLDPWSFRELFLLLTLPYFLKSLQGRQEHYMVSMVSTVIRSI